MVATFPLCGARRNAIQRPPWRHMTDRTILVVGNDIPLREAITARLVALGYTAVPADRPLETPTGPYLRADPDPTGPGQRLSLIHI